MWKKIFPYILGFIIGIILTWAISSGYNNRKINELSNTINTDKTINTVIQQANFRLSESNSRLSDNVRQLQEGTGRLEKQIRDRDAEHQRQIDETRNRFESIKTGLENISRQFESSGDIIQSVINGLDEIKKLISSIKLN